MWIKHIHRQHTTMEQHKLSLLALGVTFDLDRGEVCLANTSNGNGSPVHLDLLFRNWACKKHIRRIVILKSSPLDSLAELIALDNVTDITINSPATRNLNHLALFPRLKRLTLNNGINQVAELEPLNKTSLESALVNISLVPDKFELLSSRLSHIGLQNGKGSVLSIYNECRLAEVSIVNCQFKTLSIKLAVPATLFVANCSQTTHLYLEGITSMQVAKSNLPFFDNSSGAASVKYLRLIQMRKPFSLEFIKHFTELCEISITATRVNASGIASLSSLHSLRKVFIGVGLTSRDMRDLSNIIPWSKVSNGKYHYEGGQQISLNQYHETGEETGTESDLRP